MATRKKKANDGTEKATPDETAKRAETGKSNGDKSSATQAEISGPESSVEFQKLQLLNDRICQALDALNALLGSAELHQQTGNLENIRNGPIEMHRQVWPYRPIA